MFIAAAIDSWYFSSFRCAGLAVRRRWELVHERRLMGKYAQGRVGQNTKWQAQGVFYVFF